MIFTGNFLLLVYLKMAEDIARVEERNAQRIYIWKVATRKFWRDFNVKKGCECCWIELVEYHVRNGLS
jgi:hypothetical protein